MKSIFLLLGLAGLILPGSAVTADGGMWSTTSVENVGYVSLEDIRSFYKLMPIAQPKGSGTRAVGNGTVTLIFGPGPRVVSIHGLRCTLSHPTRPDDKGDILVSKTDLLKLIDPVLRPTYIANRRAIKTVVIDPGHGGHDSGTVTDYAREAHVALMVAGKLAGELRQRGLEVKLTREVNQHVSDQSRVDLANQATDALFLSLHLNCGRSDVSGIETYTVAPAAPGETERPANEHDAANAALSAALQSSLVRKAGAKDGGCRRVNYSLLSSLRCPAALVELGYATNREEAESLNSDEYQSKLALALADGIAAFAAVMNPETQLKALPPPPPPPAEPAKVEPPKKKAESVKKSTPRKRRPAQRKKSNSRRRKR
ncbi:MAG: N-acetylmuramoyl-L-alanine amidase [Akkermansia sp.]|nr:N-acetylmuramoyl-L-alanine amidase [Akkermansia sp.]